MGEVKRYTASLTLCPSGRVVREEDYDALRAENAELVKDRERIDLLNTLGYAYGFQDMHEGNRWEIEGPFIDVRDAIDAALAKHRGDK